MMNEHEIRLRALDLASESCADWQTTDEIIVAAMAFAQFILGMSPQQQREVRREARAICQAREELGEQP